MPEMNGLSLIENIIEIKPDWETKRFLLVTSNLTKYIIWETPKKASMWTSPDGEKKMIISYSKRDGHSQ